MPDEAAGLVREVSVLKDTKVMVWRGKCNGDANKGGGCGKTSKEKHPHVNNSACQCIDSKSEY